MWWPPYHWPFQIVKPSSPNRSARKVCAARSTGARLPDQVDDRERDRERGPAPRATSRSGGTSGSVGEARTRCGEAARRRRLRRRRAAGAGRRRDGGRTARSTARRLARPRRPAVSRGSSATRSTSSGRSCQLQWPASTSSSSRLAAERVGVARAELRADVRVARRPRARAPGSAARRAARRRAPAPPGARRGRASGSRAGCRGRSSPRRGRRCSARQRAPRTPQPGGEAHQQLADERRAPDARHPVPAVAGQAAARDREQHEPLDALGKRWAQREPDRAPVVHHEREALEPGVVGERLEEAVVARDRVVELARLGRAAEARAGRAPRRRCARGTAASRTTPSGTPCT